MANNRPSFSKIVIPILATAIFASFGYTTKSIWKVEAVFAEQQVQVRQQIKETKEDIEARLKRMEQRGKEQQKQIMDYLKDLKDDIRRNGQ